MISVAVSQATMPIGIRGLVEYESDTAYNIYIKSQLSEHERYSVVLDELCNIVNVEVVCVSSEGEMRYGKQNKLHD